MIDSKYKIFLDLDGVLCDWESQFKKFSGGVPVDTYEAEHGEQKRYELVRKNSPEYYSTMNWTKDGKILYNFVKNFPVSILSHSTDPESKVGKLKWLEDNKINFKPILVSNREDKKKYANPNSILIDDNINNITEFNQMGGIGILHTNATQTINKLKEILGVKEKHRIYNSILNPEFWTNKVLKQEILEKLLKIAHIFYKESELVTPILDIYFLGSSAGYNWTPTSDIDLHIVIDLQKIDSNIDIAKKYVDSLKNKWNQNHNITINNHNVEVYIQDIKEQNRSNAVYSIMKNKWIKMPKLEDVCIDKDSITKKYYQLAGEIDAAIKNQDLETLKTLSKRLYEMRETGLSTGGEYSVENIVFKLLRSKGYISKLKTIINNLIDKELNKN